MPTRKAASKKSPPRGSGAGKSKAPSKSKGQSTVTGLKKEPVGSTEGNTESKKRKMERRMSADKISAHLVKRPAPARVAKVAPTGFTVTKNKLERRMSANKIETHLRGREGKGLAYILERKMNKKAVKKFVESGGLGKKKQASKVAPAIQAKRIALQKQMSGDLVGSKLDNRPEKEWLEDMGVAVGSGVADRIQASTKRLQRSMSADTVKSLLETRPTLEQLQDYGIYPKHAVGVHNQIKHLERKQSQAQLTFLLEGRAGKEELRRRGVLVNDQVAPSLHKGAAHSNLDKHMRRKSLEISLQTRPSFEEVIGYHSAANFYNDGNADENEEWQDDYDDDDDDDLYYEKAVEEDYEDDEEEFEVGRWEGGEFDNADQEDDDDYIGPLPDLDERMVYAIALRAAAQLESGGFINHMQKANLKEKILDGDEQIINVVVEFVETNDASKLMSVFQSISEGN
ncbi:hypothetical protein TrRE_jg2691 [Triparma retinervis]|uniref:Uncharacterized protein n=1 Tax=Triparma retinervis TaxID=2557542 RepID=A0A9W6Z7P2_9STRA|nr:hypothetical protein TrRE_jg2691 [Triparma retinervis]